MKELSLENLKQDVELEHYGVYKIYLYSKDTPITINRFLDNDRNGLLYIGAAEKTKLRGRLMNFFKTKNLKFKQNSHSAGYKVKIQPRIQNLIDENTLMYEVSFSKKAKEDEKFDLKKYTNLYGEVPPLNG